MPEELNPAPQYDAAWKEVLDRFLPEFLAYFVPDIAAQIDWERPAQLHFLDTELQSIVSRGDCGSGRVDKLVQVHLLQGGDLQLLIHIEIQGDYEPDFPERIFRYTYRIFERTGSLPTTIVILGDDRPTWHPCRYELRGHRRKLILEWTTIKLSDLAQQWPKLEAEPGPIPTVIMAYLLAKQTRSDPESRLQWKTGLIEALADKGLSEADAAELFRFTDWFLMLPKTLDKIFLDRVATMQENQSMPHITSIERIAGEKAYKKGREEGIATGQQAAQRQAILKILQARFQAIPDSLRDEVLAIEDSALLEEKLLLAATIETIEDF